jgi:NitT/TauT family transport system substrate-binding protein
MPRVNRNLRARWFVAGIVSTFLIITGCPSPTPESRGTRSPQDDMETRGDTVAALAIGIPREPISALTIVAHEKGFFAAQGVRVRVVDTYPSGKRALAGMLDGKVDVTTAADVPIVSNSFARQDFRIIATVGSSDNEPRIIVRRESGIVSPADLRGKRVATQKASAVHFFLDTFLLKHNLSTEDVTVLFMAAEELPQALIAGDIDAFSMREPFIGQAKDKLGDQAIVFEEPGLYLKTCNLVATADAVENRTDALKRVLLALLEAERFVRDNSDEAINIVSQKLNVGEQDLRTVWAEMDLRVFLDQALLGYLEDEAEWAMRNGLTDKSEMPDYLRIVDVAPLKSVRPDVVTVIE